jgi:hypothetical protein
MSPSLPTLVGLVALVSLPVHANEPTWLAVEELLADQIEPTLLIAPAPGEQIKPTTRLGLSLRGVFPRKTQLRELARLGLVDEKALDLIDFERQRQVLAIGAAADGKPGWEDVDLQTVRALLLSSSGLAVEIASPNTVDSAITMPLPERSDAPWGAEVLHLDSRMVATFCFASSTSACSRNTITAIG